MSSPILPVTGIPGPHTRGAPDSITSTTAIVATGDVDAFITELRLGEGSSGIEAAHGGPPSRVREQIAAAAAIEQRLRASGAQLRFYPGAPGEPTLIELADEEQGTVRTLSIGEAVAIATGETAA